MIAKTIDMKIIGRLLSKSLSITWVVLIILALAAAIGGGGAGLLTVTVNDAFPSLPAESAALHATSVLPIRKVEPEALLQEIVMFPPTLSCVTLMPSSSNVALPSTLSCTVITYVTGTPSALLASTTLSCGTVMAGSDKSAAVTFSEALAAVVSVELAEPVLLVSAGWLLLDVVS